LWFPDPRRAVRGGRFDGLVAWGGDLSVERLLLAYRSGIFPWTEDPITWWSPDPRAIFELDRFHIPRSLARGLRRGGFKCTVNAAFGEVMAGCAEPRPGRERTWVSPAFLAAYEELHRLGHAHSVECWRADQLVGGIYGVAIGGLFAGESMFHRVSNASKVALVHLIDQLRAQHYALFDIQMVTPVTTRLGAVTIRRNDYLVRLGEAVALPRRFV
jgi:leucyl/phenylalanyl-tRNA--protein transferase